MRLKRFTAFLLGLSCIVSSCVKENVGSEASDFQITASFESRTKTVLSDNGSTVLWEPNESINVFYGSAGMQFTSLNTEPAPVTIFSTGTSVIFGGLECDDYIYGVYPYSPDNSKSGSTLYLTVPYNQYSPEGSFGSGAFPAVGRSKDLSMPFYNVCGGLCFTVTRPDIAAVRFRGNSNEPIAGRVGVAFDENGKPMVVDSENALNEVCVYDSEQEYFTPGKKYYISMLPAVLEHGYTMILYANMRDAVESGLFSTTSKAEIKRSTFGVLSNIDDRVSFDTYSSIKLSTSSVNFASDASSIELEVDSSSDWFVVDSSLPSWVTVTSSAGSAGKTKVTLSVTANTGLDRTARIEFVNSESCFAGLEITQYVRTLSKVSDIKYMPIGEYIPDGTVIKAVVLSNRSLNSLTSPRSLYLQDVSSDAVLTAPNSGLYLFCSSEHNLSQGDVILADVSGMLISTYNGAHEVLQTANSFTVVGSMEVNPIDITYAQFASGAYEDQYVRIIDPVQVLESFLSNNWAMPNANITTTLESYRGELVNVYTYKNCFEMQRRVPGGSGCICGICSVFRDDKQLLFAKSTDDADLIHNRFISDYVEATLSEALASMYQKVQVGGRIIAKGPLGVIINDGGDANVYVFTATNVPFNIGDVVSVSGIVYDYRGIMEIHCDTESITASDAVIPAKPVQTPVVINSDNIRSFAPELAGNSQYITATGQVAAIYPNGAFLDVGNSVSRIWMSSLLDFTQFLGKTVTVTGYYAGTPGDYNIVLESIDVVE